MLELFLWNSTYLTRRSGEERIHTFLKGISQKVNEIVRFKFELAKTTSQSSALATTLRQLDLAFISV